MALAEINAPNAQPAYQDRIATAIYSVAYTGTAKSDGALTGGDCVVDITELLKMSIKHRPPSNVV